MSKDYLDELVEKSIYRIREAANRFKHVAVLVSMGKDSTLMIWLIKMAFPKDAIPENIHFYHLDTGCKYPEMYAFRDKISKEWNIKIEPIQYLEYIQKTHPSKDIFDCCNLRKSETLKRLIKEKEIDAVMTAIRRDEMYERNLERIFSPRKGGNWEILREKTSEELKKGDAPYVTLQDLEMSGWDLYASDYGGVCDHIRVHPILDWTERDVWDCIKKENIPTVSLYYSSDGKLRHRSLGCVPCTHPIESSASNIDEIIEELKTTQVEERAGRQLDKEKIQRRLRQLGYMTIFIICISPIRCL